jgi:hypothetical protein
VRAGDLDEPRAVDRAGIEQVDVSIRRVSRTGQGALVGTLLGAAVPLLLGSIANARGGDVGGKEVKDLTRVTLPAGALLGALIGSIAKKDVWEAVDIATDHPVSLRVRLAPAPGRGVAAGVTLSWR